MSLTQETKIYSFLLDYGEGLLDGIKPEQAGTLICEGGVNPAWIIGHLGLVANNALHILGGTPGIDIDRYKSLFSGGTQASTDPAAYPAWDELLTTWREGHAAVVATAADVSEDVLGAPNPIDRFRDALPTTRDFLGFVLTGHEAVHLGQLSTWRRVQGHGPLF